MIGFGAYRYDSESRLLYRGDEEILLPPRVVAVLESLLKRPGKIVPKEDLLASAWEGAFVGEDSLTQAISQLRQALGDDPQRPIYIQTIPRRGYRFIAEVRGREAARGSSASAPASSATPRVGEVDLLAAESEALVSASAGGTPRGSGAELAAAAGDGMWESQSRRIALAAPFRQSWTWGALAVVAFAVGTTMIVFRPPADRTAAPSDRTDLAPSAGPSLRGFEIELPEIETSTTIVPLDLSRDGQQLLVWMTPQRGSPSLWLRRLGEPADREFIPLGNGPWAAFSPDGESIAFVSAGNVWKMPVEEAPPIPLAERAGAFGLDWSENDWIYFVATPGGNMHSNIQRVRSSGGEAEVLASPDASRGEVSYDFPHVLPGEHGLLFHIYKEPARGDHSQIALLDLETGDVRDLALEGGQPRYLPTGHILYGRDDTLWAAPFDLERLEVTGEERMVQRQVAVAAIEGYTLATVSDEGTIVYVEAPPSRTHRLVTLDLAGVETVLFEETSRGIHVPRLSPDGNRVSVGDDDGNTWIYDLDGRTPFRLEAPANSGAPIWMPDGQTVTYSTGRALFSQSIDGRGGPVKLLESEYGLLPLDWSPDGSTLAYVVASPETQNDIWLLRLGEGDPHTEPFRNTPASEDRARFSPDGRWFAYNSNESGTRGLYLTPFPGPGPNYRISAQTGQHLWTPDGRRIYFRGGGNVNVVDIDTGDGGSVSPSEPRALFPLARRYLTGFGPNFDIAPDGETFVMIDSDQPAPRTLRVVLGWFEHVRQRFASPR